MTDKYILDGHKAVPVDLMTWARWFEATKDGRIVAKTQLAHVEVSTVFMGLDHSFGEGPPQLFETMIFGGPQDGYQERCETWEQAEAMHAQAVSVADSCLADGGKSSGVVPHDTRGATNRKGGP
jgi:hypothetical protein